MKRKHKRERKGMKSPTADELLFQPWFLSSEIAQAIRVLIPPGYQRKMRDYFDVYGCMRCNRGDAVYQANGFCRLCHNMIGIRIRKCIRRRLVGSREIVVPEAFVGAANKASKLLRGVSHGQRKARAVSSNKHIPKNPALDVYQTLIDERHLPSITESNKHS